MKDKYSTISKYLILALLLYMPLFGHLDALPIRVWDEARLAVNAYEMSENGNLIVTYFNGEPDMWNTKPPFLIWCQAILIKIIGANELAIRLPSAFAALFTCLALLLFSLKYLKDFWFGFIVVIVLVSCNGYVDIHATRTGDYDAMLTLFSTLYCLLFFAFIETKNNRYLYGFFISLSLAILTKSITGAFFLPALLIYILWQKQLFSLLKNKHFYYGLGFTLVVVLGYYFLRELQNPGYLQAVYNNDLGGRYLKTIEGHHGGFWFYFNNFINRDLVGWYLFVPIGILVGLFNSNKRIKKLTGFVTILLVTFFLVISSAQTKIEWYEVPMYPFIAIIIALFIYLIFTYLKSVVFFNKNLKWNVMPFIFLFFIGIGPYHIIVNKTYLPKELSWDREIHQISYFLRGAVNNKRNLDNYFLLNDGYFAHSLFYIKILKEKGVNINYKNWEQLDVGDKVIAHQTDVKDYIAENYDYEIFEVFENVTTYRINGIK